jgi:glutathione S-transferase
MLTVYQHPYSQHSRRVLALLEIAQVEYRNEPVDLMAGEHRSPGFLAINPNHQVPVLVDDGITLTESNAILRYLCNRFSLSEWYPADFEARAQVDSWLDWNQCRLSPNVIDVVLNKVFLGHRGDADAIARGEANLVELGAILAAHLSDNDFLVGDAPTIADLSVASNITQLGLADAAPKHDVTCRWYARICEIEAFRRTLPPPLGAAA